ncbi:U3 small nucleolar RNA-associated protein 14-like protein A [Frankliniella fusca]|uniref:U3 small nucleolar RNA-associated protein 14-like protein A n=1 Tax=Frankliniella fusca TaxID=407009 RepID=A0AAE1HNF9_9NEOP|nr:U3 small nucleolar RNA-associated protein 14-like protein A [Frankliniella fusca]
MTVDAEDFDINNYSDSDEGGEEEHKRLLNAISKLDKRKKVLPSERREPSLQVSEFHLSKETNSDANAVHLRDLAKSLSLKASNGEIARKLKATQKKAKTLPKPLEKPAANKIRREVAFENVKEQLSQWDPVVLRNRISDDLVFPLKSSKGTMLNPEEFLSPHQGATELERQIAAVLNDSPSVQKEREEKEEYPLSLEEMIQRRKELARIKAQESYRQAKAHRQNKIKSKKYHRHARREKIRKQIKEFEELQQKDPEAALQRLEEIERERALERASLRHRSTGQWAKNQAVRAKYDKESRQVLAEQLKISKDLTQKVQADSESSDDEQIVEPEVAVSDNPWIAQTKTEADVDSFLSGYRKYWAEKSKESQGNTTIESSNSSAPGNTVANTSPGADIQCIDPKAQNLLDTAVVSYSEMQNTEDSSEKINESKTVSGSTPEKKNLNKNRERLTLTKRKPVINDVTASCGKWEVSPLETAKVNVRSLVDMFDDLQEKISEKAKKKISNFKEQVAPQSNQSKKSKSEKRKSKTADASNLLEMKRQKVQIDLDEKLDEGMSANHDFASELAEKIQLAKSDSSEEKSQASSAPELDPNKFMKTGPIKLRTALPDEVTGGDEALDDSDVEEGEKEKQLTISEAFADDDVVADFSREKQEAIDKSKPEDINLHLPGWGDWGGHNIKPNKRKRKRFIVEMPKPPPRRDENKGNLIINENEDSAARAHQVSELPFPFTSVKDYEASVRAPISNTFIPESAHRKLIKPSVRTKMGAIISPMDKDVLVKRQQKKL